MTAMFYLFWASSANSLSTGVVTAGSWNHSSSARINIGVYDG